ncbi:MAG: four helix bundle protein [Muribaculaceae bacterium]|nr:four helix bundle protein [Muribaculaceae bacterium]
MEVKEGKRENYGFKGLECWQKAHEFVKFVYEVTKHFPEDERFGLTSQFRRAAISIAANICEGYRKLTRADKLRFLNIAQGSLEECRYYIILSHDINYIDKEVHDQLEYLVNGASWKLNGYAMWLSVKARKHNFTFNSTFNSLLKKNFLN